MGDEQRGARRRRWLLLAPIALIPAIPVIIGILLGVGQSGAGTSAAGTGLNLTPAPPRPSAPANPRTSASTTRTSAALPVPPGPGAIVAVVRHSTTLRASPHGR